MKKGLIDKAPLEVLLSENSNDFHDRIMKLKAEGKIVLTGEEAEILQNGLKSVIDLGTGK